MPGTVQGKIVNMCFLSLSGLKAIVKNKHGLRYNVSHCGIWQLRSQFEKKSIKIKVKMVDQGNHSSSVVWGRQEEHRRLPRVGDTWVDIAQGEELTSGR